VPAAIAVAAIIAVVIPADAVAVVVFFAAAVVAVVIAAAAAFVVAAVVAVVAVAVTDVATAAAAAIIAAAAVAAATATTSTRRKSCRERSSLDKLKSSLTLSFRRSEKSAEILGDPYSKKSPLPSIGTSPRLAASPKDTSYRVLGQSRIHHRHITRNNHTRILAQ